MSRETATSGSSPAPTPLATLRLTASNEFSLSIRRGGAAKGGVLRRKGQALPGIDVGTDKHRAEDLLGAGGSTATALRRGHQRQWFRPEDAELQILVRLLHPDQEGAVQLPVAETVDGDGPVPQQLHLDLSVTSIEELKAQHERVLARGGRLLSDQKNGPDEPFRVYADPAGHPFCIFVA
ncbi:VOC family protein [Micromonospora sp. FIMYZ51]|uniref:VOC family protein n=1 Tax=Micromonospora sp. FIMYZ51 TaxID=3051832 RepID=UPI00311DF0BD